MSPRTSSATLVLTLGLLVVGCDSHSSAPPTAPTSTPSLAAPAPAPGAVVGERWNLTAALKSATGPAGCVVDISHMHVGWSSDWLMTIERSDESIHLAVSDVRDPTDRYEYEGTVVADVLTITVPEKGFTSSGWCGEKGGRVEFRGEIYVSGRFSGDGRVLTAEEVVSLQLTSGPYSGDTLSFHYDWRATRP